MDVDTKVVIIFFDFAIYLLSMRPSYRLGPDFCARFHGGFVGCSLVFSAIKGKWFFFLYNVIFFVDL